MTLEFWKSNILKPPKWAVCVIAVLSFAGGSLFMDRVVRTERVRADSNRVFELRIYHAVPGRLPTMESRFRDKTSRILARHNLQVVGYWVSEDPKDNSFVFLLAHQSREDAAKNWEAFRLDPRLSRGNQIGGI